MPKFVRRLGAKSVVASALLLAVVVTSLLAQIIAPFPPNKTDTSIVRQPPNSIHWFGTDNLGRDLFSRVLHGGRISLMAGLIPVLIALLVGASLGLVGGYVGGWAETLIMRTADLLLAFPSLVLTILLVYMLGPNLINALVAIGVAMIPEQIRVVRGCVLSLRERDFVLASVSAGATSGWVIRHHIVPNLLPSVVVVATIQAARAILYEAGLSFLGFGVQPPQASWGSMVRIGYEYIRGVPWLSVFPGAAIVITVLALNFVGDALREIVDPRLRVGAR